MDLNKRISEILQYSKLSASEFADEIDVQRSSVSHITSGRNKPSLEFIIKVKSKFPEINWDWLINGEGEMLKEIINEQTEIKTEDNVRTTSLPDLFTLINSEDDVRQKNSDVSEKHIQPESEVKKKSLKEMPLEKSDFQERTIPTDGNAIVKRIVIFYDNGKFESFEQ